MPIPSSARTFAQSRCAIASTSGFGRASRETGAQRSISPVCVVAVAAMPLELHLFELCSGLRAIRSAELRSSVGEVAGDRVRTHAETFTALLIRLTRRRKPDHVNLALGKGDPTTTSFCDKASAAG